MHSRSVFTAETAVVLLKNIFEFTLIRLEGFNNKISTEFLECFTWPSGNALARCVEGPESESEDNLFLLASFLPFFFVFSFSFHFRYNSSLMFLHIAYNF